MPMLQHRMRLGPALTAKAAWPGASDRMHHGRQMNGRKVPEMPAFKASTVIRSALA